ncbi:unconventional myosin-VIIa-like [Polymixia lowei]
MLRKGAWVWVDTDIGTPFGARVKETASGQRLLVDDEGKEHKLSRELEASVRVMHLTSVEGVDDMICLEDLTEAGLLRNLLIRHMKGIIYTYTGSVLVAVNPYQELPLYTADQVRLYRGRKLGELPPHVFAIADTCYFSMRRFQKDQCCIISGESGAGKTESTKLILQYLAAVSGQHSWIEQQILESNPILEAFGNAKTIHNDNSSRFGKYLEIFFNKDGVIEGARVEQYLLEKSRVCHQAPEERNYHIFYCMLAGITAEQKKTLCLTGATEYKFLTKGDCIRCEGRDDAKDFDRIRSALKVLTFTESRCWEIFKLLAAILHLGNVSFEATILNNMDSSDVSMSEHFSLAARLLEVQSADLAKGLTCRSFMTNRERVTKPLSSEQASDCRDAFVKAIYNKMFVWIVGRINHVINKTATKSPKYTRQSIGLLDIFGFENFSTNSFEQLCINFANEQLQQFFVSHIFKLEQDEYLKEDIVWKKISFGDNQRTLDLLAGKPCNLLALIDEESHFPKGTDITMLNKMNQQHRRNNIYIPSKNEHDKAFGIRHFAGVVYYESKEFLEKNRDAVSSDIIKLINTSTNKILLQIFETELSTSGVKIPDNSRIIMTPRSSLRVKSDSRRQVPTLSGQFRQSLDSLMKALSACQPFFIRCFKPNDDKQSENFDRELCMRQLRYSGMMDTVRIRKLGYPIRHTFEDFLQRYRVLLRTTVCDPKTETVVACCKAICKTVITEEDGWKVGKTKIFLKDAHDSLLEQKKDQELNRKALIIQRVMMGHYDRKCFVNKRKAAVVLQRNWRAYRANKQYRKFLRGFARLVSRIRGRRLQLQYKREQAAAVTIQSQVRGCLARKGWKQRREAVILLQAHTRGMLARKTTRTIKANAFLSAQEQAAQEQIALELQRRLEETLAQSQRAAKEPEPINEQEVVANLFGLQPIAAVAVGGRQGAAPEGFEDLEKEQTALELLEEAIVETSESESEPEPEPKPEAPGPAPFSATVLPSLPEEDYDGSDDSDGSDDNNEEFSFYKFSSLYFQGNATHRHIAHRLRQPLLPHEDEGDALACLTVWWIILRFMGDLPEPKRPQQEQVARTSTHSAVHKQGRRLSHLVGLDQKILRKNKKKQGGGPRRASTILEEPEDLTEDEAILIGEGPTLDRPLSSLEKLHIIVGYALSRRGIRDEIYCQICKQLVDNKDKRSALQGWILLSICLGIFPPTDRLLKHLESFLCREKSGYGAYCTERLRRIVANGERGEPPCWIELQATKSKKPMDVSVALMDGQSVVLPVDSACISAEVCQAVAKKVDLKDTYGFSLYIALYDKMWSLGSGKKHVMDAISQCEQEVRRQGEEEQQAPWRLYIRKELFIPWHDCSVDPVSTDLIYKQVIRGLKSGEYTCDKEDEYVELAANHYHVRFRSTNTTENTQKVVDECINTSLIEARSQAKWVQLISSAHLQGAYIGANKSADNAKAEIVDSARQKWPLYFSKFYEVTMMSGPPLPKSRFVVAVNWSGISFMDGGDKTMMELPYLEVTGVNVSSDGKSNSQLVSLTTVKGVFVLKGVDSVDMAALIEMNLEGLKERSVYAVALHDVNKPAPISLKEYAFEYFRQPGKEVGRHKAVGRERLWACSREPLKQPLLKSLVRNSELSHLACNAFTAILKYMGDYPIKNVRSPIDLTDQIFAPATKHEALQDEIYCQIMRQMSNNNNRLSMERGWQLMWLCTGLFPPSQSLLKHTQRFLVSRPRDPLSPGCQQRLQAMISAEPRNLPPHQVEVDAIQQNSTQIFHKVHFPNDTDDLFEVTSTTRIHDLCHNIAHQLNLSSAEGYGLFMKTPNKVVGLVDQKYFFDSLRQTSDQPKKTKKVKEGTSSIMPYLVIFMRKLWFNVTPGRDLTADLTFHFPQEVPKYLRGYHMCTKEEMISLAGLLFRVNADSDKSQFVMIPKMLKDLVPADQIKIMSSDEWKKHIIASYHKQTGTTVEEAKIAFLRSISRWPTFGCIFFDVKQTSESSYPSIIRIGISKHGVSFINPNTKEQLVMHPFSRITNWYSGNSYFQMTIGNLVNSSTFVCETSLGHKMDDLLRSYISMYEKERQAVRPRNQMFS